ncbi:glycoside hydrolase family 15 protein [Microbacterium sp. NPDC076911]|uniref:glycoside hydrolase family 15 protein n=1 Tax=Microbacterium sp. NPDC076911 TaxID=3154958 RepID=UPI0034486CB7
MTNSQTVDIAALATASLHLITDMQHDSGAYPASPTFSAYRGYSWFRDGAFIADAASSAGASASAHAFFDWCARVVLANQDRILRIVEAEANGAPLPDGEMLPTRFTLDGEPGADDWWDFQLDGYGTWIWALAAHETRVGGDGSAWSEAVALCVDYLCATWSRPCFDWWEEHSEQQHISTWGCVAAGLKAASGLASLDDDRRHLAASTARAIEARIRTHGVFEGRLVKWVGEQRVDASLASLFGPIGLFSGDDALCQPTLRRIEEELTVNSGVHRFVGDRFYGGGRWPLLSCMLGLAWHAAGDDQRAAELLEWAASAVTQDGFLPEQVDGHLFHPDDRSEWLERWGTVATPLLWSHAMLVRLAVELGVEVAK